MVGKMGSADSHENLLTALQTIKSYVTKLTSVVDANPPDSESLGENRAVSRLVFNARDSLESALLCACREEIPPCSNGGAKTTVNVDDEVDGDLEQSDAESHSTDITIDLEADLANVTTQDLIDEPDWDGDGNENKSDASGDILVVPDAFKTDESNNSSHTVDDDLPKNGNCATDTSATNSTAVTDTPSNQIDEFADIDFDDDFSNDGHLPDVEGAERSGAEEMLQREASPYAVSIVIVFLSIIHVF